MRILSGAVDPVHPPGYYLFLKIWSLASTYLLWERLSSIISFVLNTYLLFRLTKIYANRIINPIICVFLYAASGYFLTFDWQVRMYSGLTTLILISLVMFLRISKHSRPNDYIIFGAINFIGLYYDYGFLWYFLPLTLLTGWSFLTTQSKISKNIIITLFGSICVFFLFHPTVLSTYQKGLNGIVWMESYLNPLYIFPFFFGSHDNVLISLVMLLLVFYGLFLWSRLRSSSPILKLIYITLFFSWLLLDYSLIIRPIFHIRSFQVLGIYFLLLYAAGLSKLLSNRQYGICSGIMLTLLVNTFFVLGNIRGAPGDFLISYFPWKNVKYALDRQPTTLVYLKPLPGLPTPMLLWGLKYTLDGKETLSKKIPYKIVRDDSIIPSHCKIAYSSLIRIYRCP